MAQHFPLGPSSAHRWIPCPGSYQLCLHIQDEGSLPAREGTAAHSIGEKLLKDGKFGGDAGEPPYFYPSEEFVLEYEPIGEYVDYCRSLIKPKSLVFIEFKAGYESFIPKGYGIADFVVVTGRRIDIVDFKYGINVQVDSENNFQLMLYGLGVWDSLQAFLGTDITSIYLHIHQPRRNHISIWKTNPADLIKFGYKAARKGDEAMNSPKPTFNPGDEQCQFCPAAPICKAKLQRDYAMARKVMELAEACEIGAARTEELAEYKQHFPLLKKSIEVINKELEAQAMIGIPVPGFKVGEARTIRRFVNEEDAAGELRAHFFEANIYKPRQLISITEAETLFPTPKSARESRWFQSIIDKPIGGPVLVPVTDSRPEISIQSAAELFANAEPVESD